MESNSYKLFTISVDLQPKPVNRLIFSTQAADVFHMLMFYVISDLIRHISYFSQNCVFLY